MYDAEMDAEPHNLKLEEDLGDKFRETSKCTKEDLKKIIEWKFDAPRLAGRRKLITAYIEESTADFIARTTEEGFRAEEDLERLQKFKSIKGIGNALAKRNPIIS